MQKINKKKLLTLASILTVIGLIITIIGFLLGGRSGFHITSRGIQLVGNSSHSQDKKKLAPFKDMDISLQHADLRIIPSDEYAIEYRISGRSSELTCEVEHNKLVVKEESPVFAIGVFFTITEDYYVNLYVPKDQYFNTVRLYTDSGDIAFDSLQCTDTKLALEYGDLDGKELICKRKADISSASGDVEINNLTSGSLALSADYGDVTFDTLKCEKGNMQLDSGDLELNNTEFTDMKLQNEYGSIDLVLSPSIDDYDFNLSTDYGSVDVDGIETTSEDIAEESLITNNGKARLLKAYCDAGDITVK